jgi:hypothetical protein
VTCCEFTYKKHKTQWYKQYVKRKEWWCWYNQPELRKREAYERRLPETLSPIMIYQTSWLEQTACDSAVLINDIITRLLQDRTFISWQQEDYRGDRRVTLVSRVDKIAKSDCQVHHVCLSARNNSAPTGRISVKLDMWVFLENLSGKN